MMTQPALKPNVRDPLDLDVDEAIALAGGMRQAIKGLILGQRELLSEAQASTSAGYVRRRPG